LRFHSKIFEPSRKLVLYGDLGNDELYIHAI